MPNNWVLGALILVLVVRGLDKGVIMVVGPSGSGKRLSV